jgi:outer membrane protein assembly factor BamE (lipoprotein component of BamABCDE complex)
MNIVYLCLITLFLFTGCQPAAKHAEALGNSDQERLTVGVVQKRIQVGMSQAEVAQTLGSPNIVTKDAKGKEAWVYDKAAREVTYSSDNGSVWLIIGGYSKEAGASRSSQKTLTVVIKFDDKNLVEGVSYHSSQF